MDIDVILGKRVEGIDMNKERSKGLREEQGTGTGGRISLGGMEGRLELDTQDKELGG